MTTPTDQKTLRDEFAITYTSDHHGQGGQHTNGPDYGVVRCEHLPTQCAVEVHSYHARSQHRAREIAITLCQMAVAEMRP